MSRTHKDSKKAKKLRMKQKRTNKKIKTGKEKELLRVAELRNNDYWTREQV